MQRYLSIAALLVLLTCSNGISADFTPPENVDGPSFGAKGATIAEMKDTLRTITKDLPTKTGVVLLSVSPYGTAGLAGLKELDIITHIDKTPVKDVDELGALFRSKTVGEKMTLRGFSPGKSPSGKTVWKNGTLNATVRSKREAVFNALNVETDKFTGTTTYMHKDSPKATSDKSEIVPYVSLGKDGHVGLRWRIQFVGRDWLFIRGYDFSVGGNKFSIKPTNVSRDHSGGKIWEWCDIEVSDKENELVLLLTGARTAEMRYSGDKYKHDRELKADELQRLRDVVDAYSILLSEHNK